MVIFPKNVIWNIVDKAGRGELKEIKTINKLFVSGFLLFVKIAIGSDVAGNGDDTTYRYSHVGDLNSQTVIQSGGATNILVGGIITSTAKAEIDGKNSFTTGRLTTADLENHSNYDASGVGDLPSNKRTYINIYNRLSKANA